jgi:hypothetical protein
MNIVFSPPTHRNAFTRDRHDNVNITVNTVLDGKLPGAPRHAPSAKAPTAPQPPIFPFAQGAPGSVGVPFIGGALTRTGLTLNVIGGRPGARAALVFGFDEHELASGAHAVNARAHVRVQLDADGALRVELPRALLADLERPLLAQAWILDSQATSQIALTHILALSNN